jgi:ribonuclease-3
LIRQFRYLNYFFSPDKVLFKQIKKITGTYPIHVSYYKQSLTHHSIAQKINKNGAKSSNERLEFLGDSVLNTVIAEYLFKKYPYRDEGFLTELRSKIVSRVSLNDLALKIGLSKLVMYDKRSMQNLNLRNSIFGNALEAFIGAIFLDQGFKTSKKFVIEKLLLYHIDVDKLQQTEKNFKGRLIEYSQRMNLGIDFNVEEVLHNRQKIYHVNILFNDQIIGNSQHTNKKQAEQQAAEKAMEKLKQILNQEAYAKPTEDPKQEEDKEEISE